LISRQFRLIEDLDGIGAAYRLIDRLIRQQILAFSINFSGWVVLPPMPKQSPAVPEKLSVSSQ
jgi:hypothetical protein